MKHTKINEAYQLSQSLTLLLGNLGPKETKSVSCQTEPESNDFRIMLPESNDFGSLLLEDSSLFVPRKIENALRCEQSGKITYKIDSGLILQLE